jgi:hypothetical protein
MILTAMNNSDGINGRLHLNGVTDNASSHDLPHRRLTPATCTRGARRGWRNRRRRTPIVTIER